MCVSVPRTLSHSEPRKEPERTPESLVGAIFFHFGLRLAVPYALGNYLVPECF
jgi:hypothetical protein